MSDQTETIGDQIENIKSYKNLDDLLKLIDTKYHKPYINMLIYANIKIDIFKKLLNKMDLCYLYDFKYVDFFDLNNNSAFEYIYELLYILNNNNKLDNIIYLYDHKIRKKNDNVNDIYNVITPGGSFLEQLLDHSDKNYLLRFWELLKNNKLVYSKNCDVLLTLVNKYLSYPYDELLYIIKEFIELYPEQINIKPIPIFNHIMRHIGKIYTIYTEQEFKEVKYDLHDFEIKLLDLFINFNKNIVNLYDVYYNTPLIDAIDSNHIGLCNYLLYHNANYNYITYSSGKLVNPFYNALYANIAILNIFLSNDIINNIDFSIIDQYMNTFAHIVLFDSHLYPIEMKLLIIKRIPDLTLCNIMKKSILHILFNPSFKDDIKLYIDILIYRKLNWSEKNFDNKTPLQLVKNHKDKEIIINNLLIPNYYYNYKKIKINIQDKVDKKNLEKIIKILSKKEQDNKEFKLSKYKLENKNSIYTAHTIHMIIYIYDIIKRSNNLGKLNSKGSKYKCDNDDCKFMENIINYYDKYPNIYNYIIAMNYDKYNYYIPINIFDEIKQNIDKKPIYFITLGLYYSNGASHANIIIFNTLYKYAVRFEPYGNMNWIDIYDYDRQFEIEMKNILPNYIYYSPKDYINNLIFQAISGENDNSFIRIGDPGGYCTAWTFWFLESYLLYYTKLKNSKDLKEFVENLHNKIIKNYKSYMEYIRSYGNFLKNNEIKIIKKLKIIPNNELYNVLFSNEKIDTLLYKMNHLLN